MGGGQPMEPSHAFNHVHVQIRAVERLCRKRRLGHRQSRMETGGAIFPEMMRWLWRDQPVSTDPDDAVERSFRRPAIRAANPEPGTGPGK